MSKNSCVAAEKHGTCVLRMARVNSNIFCAIIKTHFSLQGGHTVKTAGIIAEYNPFHMGHRYQIEEVKKRTGADYVAICMSGNFLQRGVPAICDKYERTRMALLNGADLVIELPAVWSTASAEYFAHAGISLFQKMGIVTHVCFGAECKDLSLLMQIASVLLDEEGTWQECLAKELKKGASFAAARSRVLLPLLKTSGFSSEELTPVLNSPNNILAIEYLKALSSVPVASSMIPVLIPRAGAGYHDPSIDSPLASATAVRKVLYEVSHSGVPVSEVFETLTGVLPGKSLSVLSDYAKRAPFLSEDSLSAILGYRLLSCTEDFSVFADCNRDLAFRIQKKLPEYHGFSQFTALLKSRELAYTRISRALLHILLDIRQEDYATAKTPDMIPYLRILGFRKQAAPLLSALKKEASAPLVTKVADASKNLDTQAFSMLKKDLFAADVYRQLMIAQGGSCPKNEFTHGLVIVP